jgi:hypothetical protein
LRGWAVLLGLVGMAAGGQNAPNHGLGLLAGRVDVAARARLLAALGDPSPEVRASAVRVINVSGTGEVVPSIVEALRSEQEIAPATEMIRFLVALNRPELDAAVFEAAKRIVYPSS